MVEQKTALTPRSISSHFSAEQLTGQFVLSKKKPTLPWKSDSVGEWHLAVDRTLPCFRIRIGGRVVGWLLGHAIGPDGNMVIGDLELESDKIEQEIYSHGGRFLVILPLLQRMYLDPCGLLSAVYCGHAQLVASSPNLIPYDDSTGDRSELLHLIGIPSTNAMFPVGMTPRKAVERVLPNHYLDLNTWRTERHWPNRALSPVEDVSAAVTEIASITRQQVQAIIKHGPTTLNLTAGNDSRVLLACARDLVSNLECVTADLCDEVSRTDRLVAKKLASIAGVRHRTLEWVEPEDYDLELWLFRTGFGTGEYRGWRGTTMFRRQLDVRRSEIYGSVGEVARGFYWLPDDSPNTEISAARLLGHCNCPVTPETLSRMEEWKSGAVVGNSLELLDLFYVEQRLGCWAGVWTYGAAGNSRYPAFPFSHRRITELMMTLPIEMRRNGTLPVDIIAREWPEVLRYPFNKPTIPRRLWLRIKRLLLLTRRAAGDPSWALSRLLRR